MATAGIGHAIVTRLLADGFRVATTSRTLSSLASAYASLDEGTRSRLHFVQGDLATPTGPKDIVQGALAVLPGIDVLVNNAGAGHIGQHIEKASPEMFDELFTLNVRSPFFLIQEALQALSASSDAVVVNLSSVAAQRPFSGMGPYCMSKSAVDMLTQVAALELAPKRIRVVGVAPGTVATQFHSAAGMGDAMASSYYAASCATHPIGRVGTPEDISDMVSFVCSPRAGFITGSTFVVDGGRLLTSSTAPQLGAAVAPAPAPAQPQATSAGAGAGAGASAGK